MWKNNKIIKKNIAINKTASDDELIKLDSLTGGVSWKNTVALISTCDINTKNGMTRTSVDINKINDTTFKVASNNHKFGINMITYGIFDGKNKLSKVLSEGINIQTCGWIYAVINMTSNQETNILNFSVRARLNTETSNTIGPEFTTKQFVGGYPFYQYVSTLTNTMWITDKAYTTSTNIKLVPNGEINNTTTSATITFIYKDKEKDIIQKNDVNMLFFEN